MFFLGTLLFVFTYGLVPKTSAAIFILYIHWLIVYYIIRKYENYKRTKREN